MDVTAKIMKKAVKVLEFYTDKVYTAKKVHKCDLCNQEIIIGEKYHRQSGKYEGDFFDRCLHIHCNNIIAEFCKEHNENEYSHDWIVDWLSDLYCYGCGQNEDDNCEIEVLQCNCVIRNFKNLIEKDGNEDGSN